MDKPTSSDQDHQDAVTGPDGLINVFKGVQTAFKSADFSAKGLAFLNGKELLDLIMLAEEIGKYSDVLRMRVAAHVQESTAVAPSSKSLLTLTGTNSAVDLLKQVSGLSGRTVSARIRLGKATSGSTSLTGEPIAPRYPAIGEALDLGTLSTEAAGIITRTLDNKSLRSVAVQEDIDHVESILVKSATGTGGELAQNCDGLRVMCQAWAMALDQDGQQPSDHQAMLGRSFWIGQLRNGLVSVGGRLLPDAAALLKAVLDAVNSPRTTTNQCDPHASASYDSSKCQAHQSHPDADADADADAVKLKTDDLAPDTLDIQTPTSSSEACPDCDLIQAEILANKLDTRNFGAKNHDGFVTALGAIARHPNMPQVNGAPITVLVHTTEQNLQQGSQVSSEGGLQARGFLYDHEGLPTPASERFLKHAGCSGAMQRIFLNDFGATTKIEIPSRTFSASQRSALIVRDGGCAIPGCTVPPHWCEAHHVTEWSKGGKTHIDNGVLLCFGHHRDIDTSGWKIQMIKGVPFVRAPQWIDPTQKWYRVRPRTTTSILPSQQMQALTHEMFDSTGAYVAPCQEHPPDTESHDEPD